MLTNKSHISSTLIQLICKYEIKTKLYVLSKLTSNSLQKYSKFTLMKKY